MKEYLWPFYPLLAIVGFSNFVIYFEILLAVNRSKVHRALVVPIFGICAMSIGMSGDNVLWTSNLWIHKFMDHSPLEHYTNQVIITAILTKSAVLFSTCIFRLFAWMLKEDYDQKSLICQTVGTFFFTGVAYISILYLFPLYD